jgi:type VI secretion system secreted protein Hcp
MCPSAARNPDPRGDFSAGNGGGFMAIYIKVTGAKQGVFKGGVTQKGSEGLIEVSSCDFGLGAPYDHATGQATGKRQPHPVVLAKGLDQSSPLFYNACTTNEVLKSVDISYFTAADDHKKIVTVNLTNAMVREYSHQGTSQATALERITLTYTKIEFTWVNGGVVAVDDWAAPT